MGVKRCTAKQNKAAHRHGCAQQVGLKLHRQRGQGGTPPRLMLQMPSELNVFNRTVSANMMKYSYARCPAIAQPVIASARLVNRTAPESCSYEFVSVNMCGQPHNVTLSYNTVLDCSFMRWAAPTASVVWLRNDQ